MAQARYDEAAHKGRIAEADFGLGGMDVHVHFLGRNVQEQREHGMAIPRQHVGIGAAHRADQQAVLYRTAIDEQVLVIGYAPVERGQTRHASQPRRAAFQIDDDAILRQLARHQLRHACRQFLARLDGKGAASVMFQHEADVGPGHGQAAHHVQAGGIFAASAAQELAPRRNLAEQVFHADTGSGWQRGWPFLHHDAVIDHAPPAFTGIAGSAFQRQPGNAGDGRQRFTAKAQGRDHLDMFVRQLGRGVAFQRQGHLRRVHPAAVVRHFDTGQPTLGQLDGDAGRTCVDGVFDQLLQRRSRAFDHFARSNAVDQGIGQAANCGHVLMPSVQLSEFRDGTPAQAPAIDTIFWRFVKPCARGSASTPTQRLIAAARIAAGG